MIWVPGCAVVENGASQVIDVRRQRRIVGGDFVRLRQVEEAIDARLEQS